MKYINKIVVVFAGLVFALGLSVLPIQAEEDQNDSRSFDLFVTNSDNFYRSSAVTVEGSDLRVYSFEIRDEKKKFYQISLYAFSTSPISITRNSNNSYTVSDFVLENGTKVYYAEVYSVGTGTEDVSTFISSGYPNVTTFNSNTDLTNVAKGIAEEMAAAGFYDYDDSKWATDQPDNFVNYDSTLFNVSDLTYEKLSDLACHGVNDVSGGCFKLGWKPVGVNKGSVYDFFDIKLQLRYSYVPFNSTKRIFETAFISVADLQNKVTCLSGEYIICTHDIAKILGFKDSGLDSYAFNSFQINDVYKVYFRTGHFVRKKDPDYTVSYGNWSIYTLDKSNNILSLNQVSIGDGVVVAPDTEFDDDGDFDADEIEHIYPPSGDSNINISIGDINLSDIASIGIFFKSLVSSLLSILGDLPSLFARIFSFLPSEIINMIYLSIIVIIIGGLIKIFH